MNPQPSLIAVAFVAAMLCSCGPGGTALAPDEAAEGDPPASLPAATTASTKSYVRADVEAALKCHAVMSSAMAAHVVDGDAAKVAGVRGQTAWFMEAKRRAEALGMSKAEVQALMAQTRAPMITEAQKAESRALLDRCIAEVPPL